MFTIRSGVFETNSSSSHSICIRNNQSNISVDKDYILDHYVNGKGIWKIFDYDIEYGRSPFRYLSKFSEKVLYALANNIPGVEEIVKKYIPECKGFEYDNNCSGYVDDRIVESFLKKNNITLEEFLTNDKYFVICDGDEYCIFADMIKSGLISNKVNHDYTEDDLED